jgi:hypothetical protein
MALGLFILCLGGIFSGIGIHCLNNEFRELRSRVENLESQVKELEKKNKKTCGYITAF